MVLECLEDEKDKALKRERDWGGLSFQVGAQAGEGGREEREGALSVPEVGAGLEL